MGIWKTPVDIEILNQLGHGTLVEALGIVFTEVGDDYLEARMPVDHRTRQPAGILHGGASAALAETIGSVASVLCVDDMTRQQPVGIELNISHLRSVRAGWVVGRATPLRLGRRLHHWHIEIRDLDDRSIAIARLSTMIIERRQQGA